MTGARPLAGKALPSSSHRFDPVVLREYDVRGIVGKNLFDADAYALGRAFGTYVRRAGGKRMCVGRDGRESSGTFSAALMDGLRAGGIDVEFVGLGPTPMLYFAVKDRRADAGVMVTGSHNPKDYNGFKMMLQSGPVFGETIQELGRMAATGGFETGDGNFTEIDVRGAYIERLLRDLETGTAFKIAWDNGNGAAGNVLRALTEKLPGTHIPLYWDIDSDFPNHHPDPTVDKNLADLQKAVRDNECDLGIAFDGDGDRIGVVDENGTILRCDTLLALYAADVLRDRPGAPIIADVKCSQVLFDEIARLGGKPIMWKTGHSLIKSKMAEEKSPLAGELSGHIFFADRYYGFDDGLYCAIRLLNILAREGKKLSALTAHLPAMHGTPEIRFEVPEERKFAIVAEVSASVKAQYGDSVNTIDGVRVSLPGGWWLLRASNTQNALVCRAEAVSAEALSRITASLEKEVAKCGVTLKVE